MIPRSSVLIVDRSDEVRTVLRTALERRGLQIFDAARADTGLALAREHHPDLIVLDLEVQPAGSEASTYDFAATGDGQEATIVMLGSIRRSDPPNRQTHIMPQATEHFVAKPYHYKPLISKIEQLLAARHEHAA